MVVTLVSWLLKNALSPMMVTLLGIVTLVSLLSSNALFPIEVTLLPVPLSLRARVRSQRARLQRARSVLMSARLRFQTTIFFPRLNAALSAFPVRRFP
jgi:hypothetical protein